MYIRMPLGDDPKNVNFWISIEESDIGILYLFIYYLFIFFIFIQGWLSQWNNGFANLQGINMNI